MGVFLPTAALGNSRMLACFGGKGELMAFFAPRVDYAQHVREGLPALWLPDDGGGRLVFTFDETFEAQQRFRDGTNILDTVLHSPDLGLSITLTDLAHDTVAALVRRVQIELSDSDPNAARRSPKPARAIRFLHYFRLALGECDEKNAVHYLPRARVLRQMWRGHHIVVGTPHPFAHQCGKVRDEGSQVKWDMSYGHLSGQEQDIGRVDFAVGVDGELTHGEPLEFTLLLVYAESEEEAVLHYLQLREQGFSTQLERAEDRCRSWLAGLASPEDGERRPWLERALLTVRDLADATTGAIVAAPEFDPMYELSGGYGYCWPRDAAEVCGALGALGELRIPRRALDWCVSTQQGSGHWYQRYWSDGCHAPSWCVYPDFYQLDQTCAGVYAACRFAEHLDGSERTEYLREMSRTVATACDALKRAVAPDALHETAADLWEVHRGTFTYTNAALCAALKAAERVFGVSADGLPRRVKAAVLTHLWLEDEGRFARGLGTTRELERGLDSSILGVFDPYDMLDLSQPHERRMAARTLEAIERRLSVDVRGGRAILRFENESYMGGGPGVVNTLWTARAHLRLAAAYREAGLETDVLLSVGAALDYIRVALANTNPTGQLPELIPWNGYPYWAAPHGWASALMIDCVRMMRDFEVDALRARPT